MKAVWLFIKGLGWAVVLLAVFGVVMAASAIYQYFNPKEVITEKYVEVPVEKVVTKIKTVKVPGPKEVITIEKTKVVEVLKLPDWIKNDPNKQVIADGEVAKSKSATSVVTVLDTNTGVSTMVMKPKPLPFASFENEQAIGIGYGISSNGGTVAEVHARWTFARVGALYLQGYGEVNSNTGVDRKMEAKVLMQIEYRR